MGSLAELEIDLYNWSGLREIVGPATKVPQALRALIFANSDAEAHAAYWRLENHVVVQGNLFEAAEFVVPVILAALADGPGVHSHLKLLELLFQIVHGDPHESETRIGNHDLGDRCRARARDGLWLLYQHLRSDHGHLAMEVLEVIEQNASRLEAISRVVYSDDAH